MNSRDLPCCPSKPRTHAKGLALALALVVGAGCRPSSDDPPTRVDDPDAELGPARDKAKNDKEKKNDKKREEAKARRETKAGAKAKTAAPVPAPPTPAAPAAIVGKAAPNFALTDLEGKTVALSNFAGKTVVLEWFNPQCPFVKYAHADGPLKDMAKRNIDKGVVWLSINSGAPGQQGFGDALNKASVAEFGMQNPVLADASGKVGRLYGAKTTPQIFVIDAAGKLAYAGALDNAPRGALEGEYVPHAQNAIDAIMAGKAPPRTQTKAYGCSVKYGS